MDTELLEFRIEQGFSPHSPTLIKPKELGSLVTLLKENNCSYYGKFYLSGLQKGQGITVANALRRVLLYDLFGIGLTKAKFHLSKMELSNSVDNNLDVGGSFQKSPKLHEFSTVSGMRESILEFLINLRSIIWTKPSDSFSSFSGKLILHEIIQSSVESNLLNLTDEVFILQAKHLLVHTKGMPTDKSFPTIVNPEQYLATFVPITHDGNSGYFPHLEMDFELHTGNLDVPTEVFPNEFLVESGPFFPIKKVNYTVELEKNSTKTLKTPQKPGETPSECVFFEIWTNGSIHPEKALEEAFLILHTLFKPQRQIA